METQTVKRNNWLASTSLSLGILGFLLLFFEIVNTFLDVNLPPGLIDVLGYAPFLSPVVGLVAVILGSVSLAKKMEHRGQAVWGILLGAPPVLAMLVCGGLLLQFLTPNGEFILP